MIELTHRAPADAQVDTEALLTIHQRTRSRQRITLADGREAGLMVARGETLRGGDLLLGRDHRRGGAGRLRHRL
ncbi:MAG: hypothetical protein ACPGUF_01910 [Litorivicinus sp.]